MLESEIERHFVWAVARVGGVSFKFASPSNRGVADRVACFPNGATWFVELKTTGGRLSPLQKMFAMSMKSLDQNYACLWTKAQIDEWVLTV